jgi:hypothetical protein
VFDTIIEDYKDAVHQVMLLAQTGSHNAERALAILLNGPDGTGELAEAVEALASSTKAESSTAAPPQPSAGL